MDAKEFRRIRKTLKFGQEKLALELGCDRTSVTRYENGSMTINSRTEKAVRNLAKLTKLKH